MVLGPSTSNYWIVVLGRCIYGIGSELMMVMQVILVNDWFFGQELQLAVGVSESVPNLFAFLSGYFAPFCYKNAGEGLHGLTVTFIVGEILCGVSFVACIAMYFADGIA